MNGKKFAQSSCAQAEKDSIEISGEARDAQVFCFEPMPNTFGELVRTKTSLGWTDEDLVLEQIAFSDSEGVLQVPQTEKLGIENVGIDQMSDICTRDTSKCANIPVSTLDRYAATKGLNHTRIQYLSIDVEGFDAQVLLGGSRLLANVEYLEFEYNWRGAWKDTMLSTVIDSLQKKDFICYWPGNGGLIWRITDCFLSHYNLHFWSNVACANTKLVPALAKRMEELFVETLERNITMGK